jgi:transcription elongation factor GreA
LVDTLEEGFVLTREGYEEMQRELTQIITVKRPEVVDRIREARQLGDPAESFDYEDAKRLQAMVEARILELKAILAHASIVESPARDGSIGVGSKIVVRNLDECCEDEFTIVGPAESSPSEGKISLESCVGTELMGKKVGDKVMVETPGGTTRYEVVSVR